MRRASLAWIFLLLPFLPGCFFIGDDSPVIQKPIADATVPPPAPADLAQPADIMAMDLPAPRDMAVGDAAVPDLAAPQDLLMPDLAVPQDLTMAEAGPPCRGGYLNSNDPNACPLGCNPAVEPVADEGAFHLPFCTPVAYAHNPPASGNHWPWTAPWGPSKDIVPREWWVHNLEHQGIVLLYNCPYPKTDGGSPKMASVLGSGSCLTDGGSTYPTQLPAVDNCPNEIAQLEQIWATHPPDNFFNDAIIEVRMVVTQDPFLPTRFAAVAWDWTFPMNNLDLKALQCFIDARYGRGPEPAP